MRKPKQTAMRIYKAKIRKTWAVCTPEETTHLKAHSPEQALELCGYSVDDMKAGKVTVNKSPIDTNYLVIGTFAKECQE